MQKFKTIGKPLLGEKYLDGEKKIIMSSLVATMSTLARTMCVLRSRTMFPIPLGPMGIVDKITIKVYIISNKIQPA